jgi:hypothetical protein
MKLKIRQIDRGFYKFKWFCSRKEGMEYLHADGSWHETAHYFESKADIEELLSQLETI